MNAEHTEDGSRILRRHPAVSGRWHGNGELLVLYHADSRIEKALNATGAAVWRELDGVSDLTEITKKVAGLCGRQPGMIETDIREFAGCLLADNLAVARPDPLPEPDAGADYAGLHDAPMHIDICLTGKCNLKCKYCFFANEMAGRNDLPAGEWITFFDELKRLGVRTVTLSGGEIFVRPDLWQLIDSVIDARLSFSILSNGTLIDEQVFSRFEEKNRRRRLSTIQISIDGSCAEIHDASRGRGSFDRAYRALCMLKTRGYPVTSRVTVNRYNLNDLPNVARLLLEEVGLNSFGTNSAMPMGAGCDNQAEIALTPQELLQAMRMLEELANRYDRRITAAAGPLVKVRSFRDMERARIYGRKPNDWRMGRLTACGGAFMKLSVNHDGTITPCDMLPSTELGHINRDSIADIWQHHPTQKALRDRQAISTSSAAGCRDCEWAPYCNGSCPGLACELTGDFNSGNPHDCYRRFLARISEEDRHRMFILPVEREEAERIGRPGGEVCRPIPPETDGNDT